MLRITPLTRTLLQNRKLLQSMLCAALMLAIANANAQQDAGTAIPDPTATTTNPPAAASAPALPMGDVGRGKRLTYTCQGCHGVTGYKNAYPNFHVPKIGGQSPQYLMSALTDYKLGHRKHPTMQVQAQSFSVQDIADISAFLSGLK